MSAMSAAARFCVDIVDDSYPTPAPHAQFWATERADAFRQAREKLIELREEINGGFDASQPRDIHTDGESLWFDTDDGRRISAHVEDVYAIDPA